MASESSTTTRPPFLAVVFNYLAYLFLFAVCGVTLFLAWPMIQARLTGQASTAPQAPTLPTAIVAPRPASPAYQSAPEQPAIAPVDAIANYNATAEAAYRQAIQQQPNVDTTNDAAPVLRESKPAPDRQPAGENVPTAVPQTNDQFGSKPAAPLNIQETHTCLHGQVWTERGCKNPTAVQP